MSRISHVVLLFPCPTLTNPSLHVMGVSSKCRTTWDYLDSLGASDYDKLSMLFQLVGQ